MPLPPFPEPFPVLTRGRMGYWIFQAVFWLVILAFTVLAIWSQPADESPIPLTSGQAEVLAQLVRAAVRQAWLEVMVGSALGLGLTHFLMEYSRRRDWLAGPMLAMIGKSLTASVGMALLVTAGQQGLTALWLEEPTVAPASIQSLLWIGLGQWLENALQFAAWCALFYGYQAATRLTRLRVQQLEQQAATAEARLDVIHAQLNPHFLFNSLNTVRGLIDEDPARARDAVTALAQVLRASLQSTQHRLIPLAEELSTVGAQLSLELARHGDRLTVQHDLPPETLTTRVPPLLVQTLVENAVKHGVGEHPGAGTVHYAARLEAGALVITIQNDGVLKSANLLVTGGLGLAHTRERLHLLFGPAAVLTLEADAGRVIAQVRIPQNHRIPSDA